MAAISASRSTADNSCGDRPPPPAAFTVSSVIRALPGAVFTRIVVWAPAPPSGVTVMVKLATASLQEGDDPPSPAHEGFRTVGSATTPTRAYARSPARALHDTNKLTINPPGAP